MKRRRIRTASCSCVTAFISGAFCWRRSGWRGTSYGWCVLYLSLTTLLEVGLRLIGTPAPARAFIAGLIALLVGMEAASLRRWTLNRRRHRNLGVVVGDDPEVAERRFFRRWARAGKAAAEVGDAANYAAEHAARGRARHDRPVPEAGMSAMTTAIVDYGSGNLHSAAKAFERAAREAGLREPIASPAIRTAVRRADRVVLPGVGAFADCRRGLDAVPA